MRVREDGVYFGHQEATVGEVNVVFGSQERSGGRQRGTDGNEAIWTWLMRFRGGRTKTMSRWMERPKGEVIMMDKDCEEKLEMEEHVPVPKRVYKTREDLEVFKFTARCPGRMPLSKGTAREAHTENRRRRIEEESRSTVKAEAPQRRVKEYQDKAAARGTKQKKKSENKNGKRKRTHQK